MVAPLITDGFSDTLVILGAAGLVIPAFARLRISPVIGFILVGMLVGPTGLGALVDRAPWLVHVTITDEETIKPFADFGIILLLFTIGLELSFRRLWGMRQLVFGVGAAELLLNGAIIGGALMLVGTSPTAAMGIGIALALSSTALVLPMTGTKSAVGRPAFAMLLFEDLALVPIVFMLGALAPTTGGDALEGLGLTALYGGLATIGLFFAGRFIMPVVFAQAARTKSPEIFLAASLLAVMVSSLVTSLVGLSPIVGALVAGLLIAETEYQGEVEVIIAPFKGLALGIFLITVGMQIDLAVIVEDWASLAAAVVGVMVVKTLVTFGLLLIARVRRGAAIETALLMASPSETTLIVLGAAVAAQLVAPEIAGFWQIVTAIGLTITPLLARIGRDIARRVEIGNADLVITGEEDRASPDAVIIGFGRVGQMVADMMKVHNQPYLAVESDIDAVSEGRRNGYNVRFGDASRPEMLDRLRLGHARALIITMNDPVLSVRITRRVRGWVPDLPIIARARDPEHAAELYRAGASDAVPETLESSLQLAETALVDLGIAMGPVIASIHQHREELREQIMASGQLSEKPRLRRVRDGDD